MLRSRLGLIAATVLVAGVAGCSLPEVLPLAGGTTSGPSPYGVWYEQHWATNAVLLAAADGTEEQAAPAGEDQASEAQAADAAEGEDRAEELGAKGDELVNLQDDGEASSKSTVEASLGTGSEGRDFDDSTAYQFPGSAYPQRSTQIPGDDGKPVAPKSVSSTGGPIRY